VDEPGLAGFRFTHQVEVRFRDLDLLGHVNNAVYHTYLESARLAWWMHVSGSHTLRDIAMILARTEIDYRRAARLGQRLRVGVRCVSLRRASFVLALRVVDAGDGALVAEARKVLAYYDYAAQRSLRIPAELRAAIRRLDPDALDEG
jgi:acyl-CoA thioester hydrolase